LLKRKNAEEDDDKLLNSVKQIPIQYKLQARAELMQVVAKQSSQISNDSLIDFNDM